MAHIPQGTTAELELLTFQDALKAANTPSREYDIEKWLYAPNFYSEYRYILGTRGKNPLICIGINPSTARPDALDNTLKSVERIALGNGFDSFILTTFGKRSGTYRYSDIKGQRLYVIQGGSVVVELHMTDGRSVSLQSTMTGTYDFLDHAFAQWCRQTGRSSESCDFHDTGNHLWFPTLED